MIEDQFKDALNGIRTLMTVGLQSVRAAGKMDDTTVTEFGHKLRTEIIIFKRAAVAMQTLTDERMIQGIMHGKLEELLDIMGSPHPEYAKAGFYVSPDKPTDPVYFWAYQDLFELCEWIQEWCSREAAHSVVLSQASEAVARHEFNELPAVEEALCARCQDPRVVKVLMQPFSRFKSPRSTGLQHRELVNLRKLKAAILDTAKQPDDKIENALHALLYGLNVNTDTAIAYCKARIEEKLRNIPTDDARLKVLALEKKLIGQTTVKDNVDFDVYNHKLTDEILKFIEEEREFRTQYPEPPTAAEPAAFAIPDAGLDVRLGVTNEHHAAHMRALQRVSYFSGREEDIIELTGRLVLSDKARAIGMPTYRRNYFRPTAGGAKDAFDMSMKIVGWMSASWRHLDVPNLATMEPHKLHRFVLSYIPPHTSSK